MKAQIWINRQLDDELSAPRAARLRSHLAGCPECARLERQMRGLAAGLRRVRASTAAPAERPMRFEPDRVAAWRAGLATAAAVALVLGASWWFAHRGDSLHRPVQIALNDSGRGRGAEGVPAHDRIEPTSAAPTPAVRVEVAKSSPMLAVPVETGDSNVTILQVYPKLSLAGEPRPQSAGHRPYEGATG